MASRVLATHVVKVYGLSRRGQGLHHDFSIFKRLCASPAQGRGPGTPEPHSPWKLKLRDR